MDRKIPLEELRCLGQSSNFEIKQEPDDAEFNIEDLHHSIDIKEEIPFVDPEEIKCECYLCGIQFCDKSQLIEHLETQCLEKPLSCEICAFRCLTKLQLSRHMKTHIDVVNEIEPVPFPELSNRADNADAGVPLQGSSNEITPVDQSKAWSDYTPLILRTPKAVSSRKISANSQGKEKFVNRRGQSKDKIPSLISTKVELMEIQKLRLQQNTAKKIEKMKRESQKRMEIMQQEANLEMEFMKKEHLLRMELLEKEYLLRREMMEMNMNMEHDLLFYGASSS